MNDRIEFRISVDGDDKEKTKRMEAKLWQCAIALGMDDIAACMKEQEPVKPAQEEAKDALSAFEKDIVEITRRGRQKLVQIFHHLSENPVSVEKIAEQLGIKLKK